MWLNLLNIFIHVEKNHLVCVRWAEKNIALIQKISFEFFFFL